MKRHYDAGRLLRWYPTRWRARYGDEFLAYLEDRLDDSPLTFRLRSSIAFAGVRERCYGSGMVCARSTPVTQRRTGSLMVLVAWSLMIVGGAALAKMAEHFRNAMPKPSRAIATLAFNATTVAGVAGTILVLVGAIVACPGFVRFLREKGWPQVRRTLVRSVIATVVLFAATSGLASWSHQLNTAQRNGADALYSGAFFAFALFVVMTIALWTRASIAVASRIDFTPRALRWESYLALGVCLSSIVVAVGATAWWIQVGRHAPWLLNGTLSEVSASPWSLRVVGTALVTAFWGAARIAMSYRPSRLGAPEPT